MITANPDIVEEDLTNDINFIVIACDGIWDCLSNQECCDFISESFRKIKVALSSPFSSLCYSYLTYLLLY